MPDTFQVITHEQGMMDVLYNKGISDINVYYRCLTGRKDFGSNAIFKHLVSS